MRRRTSLELAIVLDESGSRTTKAAFPRKKLRVCRTGRLPIAVERAIALDGSRSLPDRRYEARSQGNRCSAHRFTCVSAHRIRCSPLRLVLGCQNRCFYACPKAALHYSRSIESGSEARTGLSAPFFPVWYRFFRFGGPDNRKNLYPAPIFLAQPPRSACKHSKTGPDNRTEQNSRSRNGVRAKTSCFRLSPPAL